jgi:hypothetical protein
VRVPEENVISGTKGNGDLVISKAFTWSGPVAAIAAVGVARAAYEYTLEWAKGHTAGGAQPIMQHQHVGYLLSDVAMKIEAARYLSWKSAQYLDLYVSRQVADQGCDLLPARDGHFNDGLNGVRFEHLLSPGWPIPGRADAAYRPRASPVPTDNAMQLRAVADTRGSGSWC